MNGRTHDLAALTGLLLVVTLLDKQPTVTLGTAVFVLLANQLGGIAPDIDQPTAPFWRNLPVGNIFGRTFTKLLGGHRFLTHSLIGVFALSWLTKLLLAFISPIFPTINMGYVWGGFMIGVISHLIMDSFTKEGVPWLLPLPIKFGFPPIKKFRIVTGEKMENFVIFPALIGFNIWFIAQHYAEILDLLHKHVV